MPARQSGGGHAKKFVFCVQNHDQIGNRALGDRLASTLSPEQLRLAATLLLFLRHPMLFMGEEYRRDAPVPVFLLVFGPWTGGGRASRGGSQELASVKFAGSTSPPIRRGTRRSRMPNCRGHGPAMGRRACGGPHRSGLASGAPTRPWFAPTPPRTVTKAEVLGTEAGSPCLWFEQGAGDGADLDCRRSVGHEVDVPSAQSRERHYAALGSTQVYGGTCELAGNVQRLGPYQCVIWGPAGTQRPPRLAEIG